MSALAPLRFEPGRLSRTPWWGYALRFLFGGAVTVATGLIASEWGPVVGGLFLAFPAILPASVTLLERSEGKASAGVSAFGAVLGGIGMLAFAGLA